MSIYEINKTNLKNKENRRITTKQLVMLGVISTILMLFEFPIPLTPTFVRMDFSELPIILGGFMMGSLAGFLIIVIKIGLNLILNGTTTMGVGELANMIGSVTYLLNKINILPFYAVGQLKDSHRAIGQSFTLLVTVSGLLIDENQQVLDEEFEPIEGLYATGNNSGCRFGFQYTTSVPGQSISIAHTLGREVGRYVAELNRR